MDLPSELGTLGLVGKELAAFMQACGMALTFATIVQAFSGKGAAGDPVARNRSETSKRIEVVDIPEEVPAVSARCR